MMVSHRTLKTYRTLHRSTDPWILDSGAFTELLMYGEFRTTPREYVQAVARYQREIGNLVWAAPQDMMCEPQIIHGGRIAGRIAPGTGLTEEQHQRLSVANLLELRSLWPEYSDDECPFIPVIQGGSKGSHIRNFAHYGEAGIRFTEEKVTGIGSVCRLQSQPREICNLMRAMRLAPRIHGFGLKTTGLLACHPLLTSSDSLAWSYAARMVPPFPGHSHNSCANCLAFACVWRRKLLESFDGKPGLDLEPVDWINGQKVCVHCWKETQSHTVALAA
jgi:hypothetical protein